MTSPDHNTKHETDGVADGCRGPGLFVGGLIALAMFVLIFWAGYMWAAVQARRLFDAIGGGP